MRYYHDEALRLMVQLSDDPASYVEKPYPNEHACRLREPGDFRPDTFVRMKREHEGKEYSVIAGKLKGGDNSLTDQAFRYNKDAWTEEAARKHCQDHDGISFEPASEKSARKDFSFHAQIMKQPQEQGGNLFIEGWASTKNIDRADEVVEPGAFEAGIAAFLRNPILLYMHDWFMPVGKIVSASIEAIEGFRIKAMISAADDVSSIRTKIKEGILTAFSIGFRELEGDRDKQGIWHIKAMELYEVSIVSIPCNREALFSVAKGMTYGNDLVVPSSIIEEEIKQMKNKLAVLEKGNQPGAEEGKGSGNVPLIEEEYFNFKAALEEVNCMLNQEKEQDAIRKFAEAVKKLKGVASNG